jgi:hypothetical protein
MSFLAGGFLVALVAAVGPLVIHFLNRRRHRTVEWAAMDFLREAIRRNKRLVEFRDLLLLALRTLAVILFVLAMARPYWVSDDDRYEGQPVHAVLVVDNSLSMGYTQLDETLLDAARTKASEFVKQLPKGSDVSIIPLCHDDDRFVRNVYSTTEDALDALERIELVDRAARASDGAELARRALKEASEVPTKRVVFFSDMQTSTWSIADIKQYFADLGDVQTVQVIPPALSQRSNTAVVDFRLIDGVADAESPAIFVANIQHRGPEPRSQVRVTLKVDDAVAQERFVDLVSGQNLELEFPYQFDVAGTANEPLFVPARVEITPDRLEGDDFRTCIVPVVAQLPVLFIDEQGSNENPRQNVYGETWPMRRWLAPKTSRDDNSKSLFDVRLRTPSQVTRDDLRDARLVVMSGVTVPSDRLVQDLRQYAEQGGQVLLTAGGEFNPSEWNAVAWQDGAGILPAPLKPQPIGRLAPAGVSDWPKFRLASNTCRDEIFHMNLTDQQLDDVLNQAYFHKAVGVDEESLAEFGKAERTRQEERKAALDEYKAKQLRWSEMARRGGLSEEEAAARQEAEQALQNIVPNWLGWSNRLGIRPAKGDQDVDQLVARSQPRVMGRYDNNEVFAIRRAIGDGEVFMVTSGCFPRWNNIAADPEGGSILIFHQILQRMLTRALPNHTIEPTGDLVIPIATRDQAAEFSLVTPNDDEAQLVGVEAISESEYGVVLRSLDRRGIYELRRQGGEKDESAPAAASEADEDWSLKLAVNGPGSESDLESVDQRAFEGRLDLADVRWLALSDPISLEGKTYFGHDVWKYLLLGALLCLLLEMVILLPRVTAWMTGNIIPTNGAATPAERVA